MNQVPGKLLLWDTKTMKQQVLPGLIFFLSLLVEIECLLFQCVGALFLNFADFLLNTLLFYPFSFPSITCRMKMKCRVWVGFFLGLFYEGFFRVVHTLVSILPAQLVSGYVPSGLNDALLRLSPVELY